MELRRPFGIDELLTPANADAVYDRCNELLATDELRVRGIMQAFDVRAVCTTDDPGDDLAPHRAIAADPGFPVVVAPAFRPDKAMAAADPAAYNAYLERLGAAAGIEIGSYADLLRALEQRHGYFHEQGCRLSDHGIEEIYADPFTQAAAAAVFAKVRAGTPLERARAAPAAVGAAVRARGDGRWARLDPAVPPRCAARPQHPPGHGAGAGYRLRQHG